ncbi:hypothetical protein ACF1G5_27060 [Streptomyces coeruleorubidus]|uniref:hypothetical protein n=1 Tax=Streptomyces coeruleorubidus TaxID=116188 RepID=UPI0037027C2B
MVLAPSVCPMWWGRVREASTAGNGSSQLTHLSLAEIRRLITRLTDRRPAPIDHILHWSTWRRRRQHQARVSHYKRRGHSP